MRGTETERQRQRLKERAKDMQNVKQISSIFCDKDQFFLSIKIRIRKKCRKIKIIGREKKQSDVDS